MNYRIDRNNYHQKPKSSIIYTPPEVSQFIFNLLSPHWPDKKKTIIDPCSGMGSLLKPWKDAGYSTLGVDIDKNSTASYKGVDFLKDELFHPPTYKQKKRVEDSKRLFICNPPFNRAKPKLAPEVWLDRIIEIFGKEMPIVLFVPMGFRLNPKKNGKRWGKFIKDAYPPISSIISLPRDIFPNVEFHSEILIYNLPHLQPHYFYHGN